MKLYLIRHGESENNLSKKWTGWMDVNLTEKGIDDAKRVRPILAGVKFDKVYSSDLKRAYDTAKTALPDFEPEKTSLIREIDVGDFSGKTFEDCKCLYKKERELINQTGGYDSVNGESVEQFTARLKEFLEQAENSGYENIAAFCHGGVLRRMLNIVIGQDLPRGVMLCKNCAVAIFEYTNETWYVDSWINI